jgi:phage-related protein
MTTTRPLACSFYRTGSGNEPVREWLKSLRPKERLLIGIDIKTVQYVWPIGRPLVGSLGDGLWEIRTPVHGKASRVLFTFWGGRMVLLSAFFKRTQQTPVQELRLARSRKNEIEQAFPSRR